MKSTLPASPYSRRPLERTLGSGQVLIAGGSSDGTVNGALNTGELFNAGAFTPIASLLSAPRWQAAAALLLNGNVLVAGGQNSAGPLTSADLYNPGGNTFTASASQMAQARVNGAAVAPQVTSTSQLGVSTATLNVASAGFTQNVPLSANVIDPEAQFTPASLDFGTQPVNSSTTLTTTLKNVGLTVLNIQSFTIGGSNPADFTFQSFCPASLAPGSSCNVNVTFKPLVRGNLSATLVLTSNSSTTVTLNVR